MFSTRLQAVMFTVFSVYLAHHHVTAALCVRHDVKIGVWTSSDHLLFVCFSQHHSHFPSSLLGWTTYSCCFDAFCLVSMMLPLSLLESCIHQSTEKPSTPIKTGSEIVTRRFLSLCYCHYMNVIHFKEITKTTYVGPMWRWLSNFACLYVNKMHCTSL